MEPALAFVATVVTAGLTAAATVYAVRQYQRLGIGEAQKALSEIRDDTIDALKAQCDVLLRKVEGLEDDARSCKSTLAEVQAENAALTSTVKRMLLREQERGA